MPYKGCGAAVASINGVPRVAGGKGRRSLAHAAMPTIRRAIRGGAGAPLRRQAVRRGRLDEGVNIVKALEVYGPAASAWTAKAQLAAMSPGSAVLNGKLYVAGGGEQRHGQA